MPVKVGFAVAGFDQDALGREPRFGVAAGFGRRNFLERDIREVDAGHAAHAAFTMQHKRALESVDRYADTYAPQSWSGCWWLTISPSFSGP